MFNSQNHLTLNQLCSHIKQALKEYLEPVYWVVAEISDIRTNYTGHCYLELIEKDLHSDSIIAKSRATIWSSTYRMLRPYFESSTNQKLQAGITVLVKVSVEYHSVYGFSLNIRDIDPVYTLGEQERRKIAIIKQLEDEGIIGMNMELQLPEIMQSIAIISSEHAAGYGDFMQQLHHNPYHYSYKTTLFNATMQGERAVQSIIAQLDTIYACHEKFDAVVIIRGGGAVSDLLCFDNYELAAHIAQFPLPIITGIGHERDRTIADIVAHTSLKTPTAVAEFIVEQSVQFQTKLATYQSQVDTVLQRRIAREKERLSILGHSLPRTARYTIHKQQNRLLSKLPALSYALRSLIGQNNAKIATFDSQLKRVVDKGVNNRKNRLKSADSEMHAILRKKYSFEQRYVERLNEQFMATATKICNKEKHKQQLLQETAKVHDPAIQFEKGYSLTFYEGKVVKSIADVSPGDSIISLLKDGNIKSEVKTSHRNK